MADHTPPPWRAQRWMEDASTARLFGPKGETLAVFHDVREEGPSNLALARAAPDLLEVAKAAEQRFADEGHLIHSESIRGRLRTAISKAEPDLT